MNVSVFVGSKKVKLMICYHLSIYVGDTCTTIFDPSQSLGRAFVVDCTPYDAIRTGTNHIIVDWVNNTLLVLFNDLIAYNGTAQLNVPPEIFASCIKTNRRYVESLLDCEYSFAVCHSPLPPTTASACDGDLLSLLDKYVVLASTLPWREGRKLFVADGKVEGPTTQRCVDVDGSSYQRVWQPWSEADASNPKHAL